MARKKVIVFPHSKLVEAIGNFLVKEINVKKHKSHKRWVKAILK